MLAWENYDHGPCLWMPKSTLYSDCPDQQAGTSADDGFWSASCELPYRAGLMVELQRGSEWTTSNDLLHVLCPIRHNGT